MQTKRMLVSGNGNKSAQFRVAEEYLVKGIQLWKKQKNGKTLPQNSPRSPKPQEITVGYFKRLEIAFKQP